jgi:outer membrane protein assembly factor BamA
MTRKPLRQACLVVAATVLAGAPARTSAQSSSPTGLEIGALPVVNFDSDEGFGYGALAAIYEYGTVGFAPYEWVLRPQVFLTTEGRRDLTLFFDAPYLLPNGWRLTVFVGTQKHVATPFYGLGNASAYDESLDDEDGANPYFYRFGLRRDGGTFMLQRPVGVPSLRVLLGGGVQRATVDPVPEDRGTTLYEAHFGADEETSWTNFVRGGVVWDTRDRESGPTSGTWTELLVQWVDEGFGADVEYTRWTFTDRRYLSLADGLVFAHRYLVRGVTEGAPVHDLFNVQSSFEQQEGLGGASTVRGVLKNRFVGRGMLVWNAELRWRVADFRVVGRDAHLVLSAFVDHGRVWAESPQLDQLLSDLRRGFGGGARIGLGENFVVALDVGTSTETGLPFYMGLGYLF